MSPLLGLDSRSRETVEDAINNKDRVQHVPASGKDFAFEGGETRVFELPLFLFERRHFYRSELREA